MSGRRVFICGNLLRNDWDYRLQGFCVSSMRLGSGAQYFFQDLTCLHHLTWLGIRNNVNNYC